MSPKACMPAEGNAGFFWQVSSEQNRNVSLEQSQQGEQDTITLLFFVIEKERKATMTKKKLTVGTKHRNSQWPIKPKEKTKLFSYFRSFMLPFRSCLLNLKFIMKDLPIMVLNIKLLHHTWDFTQCQYSVTSFMFKGHIGDTLSLEPVRGSPRTRRLKAL